MIVTALAVLAFLLAAVPALLYARNVRAYRPPPALADSTSTPHISVLIPARNEEASIADAVSSVLASRNAAVEVIVLDDHSEDRTAAIVTELAAKDPRVRLERAPPLPEGWNGKQHACHVLAELARYPILLFIDADVRLEPEALARMNCFREASGASLVSGFPRQITETWLERLVIPLIHFVLLAFLPLHRMRASTRPGYGAGCGQWFLTMKDDYTKAGGHAAIRGSRHDGVKLPRAYRQAGLMTDLCDVTSLASCQMYRSSSQVWNGLAKNATEGLGAPRLILFTTCLLFVGQVLPWILVFSHLPQFQGWVFYPTAFVAGCAAIATSYAVRFDMVRRFHQSWMGAILHPVGIVILLAIQWYALVRGRRVSWKGRT